VAWFANTRRACAAPRRQQPVDRVATQSHPSVRRRGRTGAPAASGATSMRASPLNTTRRCDGAPAGVPGPVPGQQVAASIRTREPAALDQSSVSARSGEVAEAPAHGDRGVRRPCRLGSSMLTFAKPSASRCPGTECSTASIESVSVRRDDTSSSRSIVAAVAVRGAPSCALSSARARARPAPPAPQLLVGRTQADTGSSTERIPSRYPSFRVSGTNSASSGASRWDRR